MPPCLIACLSVDAISYLPLIGVVMHDHSCLLGGLIRTRKRSAKSPLQQIGGQEAVCGKRKSCLAGDSLQFMTLDLKNS